MKVIRRGDSVVVRGRLDPEVTVLLEYPDDEVLVQCRHPQQFMAHRRDGLDPRCLVCGLEGAPGAMPPMRTWITYEGG